MKKKIFSLLLLAAFASPFIYAQNADKILESYFETIGQDKLVKVNTVSATGKIGQMGMEMPFRTVAKRPNKGYLEAEFQGTLMKMGYDGEKGWMTAPWSGSAEPIDLTGPDVKQVKEIGDIDSPLWKWEGKGHKLDYAGSEDMEGTKVHVLTLTKDDGDITDFYIDADNFVILKTKTKIIVNDSENEVETFLSNYQEVNGIIQPFTIESRIGGQTVSTITIEEVKYDEKIDDSIFEKPVK